MLKNVKLKQLSSLNCESVKLTSFIMDTLNKMAYMSSSRSRVNITKMKSHRQRPFISIQAFFFPKQTQHSPKSKATFLQRLHLLLNLSINHRRRRLFHYALKSSTPITVIIRLEGQAPGLLIKKCPHANLSFWTIWQMCVCAFTFFHVCARVCMCEGERYRKWNGI